ncbi:MAG TPA: carboxypeptidase-like regulatory domain-containing protein, partial [Bryobacteraceae bacterium]|nr:carboxypeptidase-like regulatory domain-containing protein [Bryobacteraceae bacterium]
MLKLTSSLVLLCFVSFSLRAQFETATLTGVVSDPVGAVIASAAIKVLNEATNIEVAITTDENGRFTVPGLRPGTYQLSASAPGFKQFVSTGLVLQVNQSARLDVQLTVGEVSER